MVLPQLIVNGLVAGCGYALIACGFTLILSVGRVFHFAHAAIYAATAYALYAAVEGLDLSYFVAVPFAALVAIVLALGCEGLVYRPLRHRGASATAGLLASLGMFTVATSLIPFFFGAESKTLFAEPLAKPYTVDTVVVTGAQLAIVAAAIVFIGGLLLVLRHTQAGIRIRCVASNPTMARVVGLRVDRVIALAYVLATALLVPAALLTGLEQGIRPAMGIDALFNGVIAVIVGGIGSVYGAIIAALLLGLAQNVGIAEISSQWQSSIGFAVLILVLLVRPTGLVRTHAWTAKV